MEGVSSICLCCSVECFFLSEGVAKEKGGTQVPFISESEARWLCYPLPPALLGRCRLRPPEVLLPPAVWQRTLQAIHLLSCFPWCLLL